MSAARRGRAGGRRIRVGVVFGGRSVEHDVSLVSAGAIMDALDRRRYQVLPIPVSREGRWPAGVIERLLGRKAALDVVIPMIHGTDGEDGSLQGLLTLSGVPFVGAGVLGSAVGMDKAVMKSLLQDAGLPTVRHRVVTRAEFDADAGGAAALAERHCGLPLFVKPANGGSSVGVSKVRDRAALEPALRLAFRYDRKVIAERAIDAREIECSVLGNDAPEASVLGEIVPAGEFYDYVSKYQDKGSRLLIPAPIEPAQAALGRDLAVRAFQALDLSGMARVDLFLDRATGAFFLNEVNTLPGFTPISMYPKLWEASGLPFPRLVDRLVRLAFERRRQREGLVTRYRPAPRGEARPAAAAGERKRLRA
ncbi:MAG TPA: D-alanine--D-alanine ligase family protein [Candidatus Polarisedimenticolia bacterium]|nr:D-alanine--D-alanine ligase family protein [Candidatus Polarisedimenticolia bacterium]